MPTVEEIMVAPPAQGTIVDPMAWFETPGPFELEIGCGKGGFLLSRAQARPNVRLLGIEWANKYYRYCADRMARRRISNVRVMRTDAKVFVMHHLPSMSLSALHLYHPDPWPKKRHHKRRIVQADFIDAVARVLVVGGRWLIQTDHAEYFDRMQRAIARCEGLSSVPWELGEYDVAPDWGGTNYEIKYTREGRPIYRAAYAKTAHSDAASLVS
ncbi:MAG: tRNA (guanosine(46)-N7)-methyltransferase TrmB [Phycisphaerae bacterium]